MKKFLAIAVLLICMLSFDAIPSQAGVPNIPRRSKSHHRSSSSSSSSRGTVWGTQYDWLSTRYVTYSDIQYLQPGQIRVLKNSIYARHGRKFKDANLRSYFNSCSWYYGYRNDVPSRELSSIEQANIAFLKRYE